MNDVTMPHALCIEKHIMYYFISFREGWYGFRKPQCGDPEHRITLCEINSIKNDNIDVDIINKDIVFAALKSGECHLVINILITWTLENHKAYCDLETVWLFLDARS